MRIVQAQPTKQKQMTNHRPNGTPIPSAVAVASKVKVKVIAVYASITNSKSPFGWVEQFIHEDPGARISRNRAASRPPLRRRRQPRHRGYPAHPPGTPSPRRASHGPPAQVHNSGSRSASMHHRGTQWQCAGSQTWGERCFSGWHGGFLRGREDGSMLRVASGRYQDALEVHCAAGIRRCVLPRERRILSGSSRDRG